MAIKNVPQKESPIQITVDPLLGKQLEALKRATGLKRTQVIRLAVSELCRARGIQ
jgi:hypothetical protein